MTFRFREWGVLTDGTIDLTVQEREPADPGRHRVPCYHFRISRHRDGTSVGSIALRVGRVDEHPDLRTSGQVGYRIDEAYRGHGYAGRACRLLRPVALAHGLSRLMITCDPTNRASRRTLDRIGAELIGEFPIPPHHPMYQDGRRSVLRFEWSLGAAS
ncbi:MAG TPA: GNAT family N-acetyltransferase [Thermoplasmata archaeon]|nr:GNAT family N-acetyltransferase [Thermoplasmata archaeon]